MKKIIIDGIEIDIDLVIDALLFSASSDVCMTGDTDILGKLYLDIAIKLKNKYGYTNSSGLRVYSPVEDYGEEIAETFSLPLSDLSLEDIYED